MQQQVTQADQELLSQFRDFMARQGGGPSKFVPLKLDPLHRGVQDANYVRPAPTEFPRMMHHKSGLTKIADSLDEQRALEKQGYSTQPTVQKPDWRARANEVRTKSGFQVHTHHVMFLQKSEIPNVDSLQSAAEFLDKLTPAEQEQFFHEAEQQEEEPVAKKK